MLGWVQLGASSATYYCPSHGTDSGCHSMCIHEHQSHSSSHCQHMEGLVAYCNCCINWHLYCWVRSKIKSISICPDVLAVSTAINNVKMHLCVFIYIKLYLVDNCSANIQIILIMCTRVCIYTHACAWFCASLLQCNIHTCTSLIWIIIML